jgi:hypothetical protein
MQQIERTAEEMDALKIQNAQMDELLREKEETLRDKVPHTSSTSSCSSSTSTPHACRLPLFIHACGPLARVRASVSMPFFCLFVHWIVIGYMIDRISHSLIVMITTINQEEKINRMKLMFVGGGFDKEDAGGAATKKAKGGRQQKRHRETWCVL